MKKHLHFAILAITLLLAGVPVSADVPPEPGNKRVTLKLILEPKDELPDYRFFVNSGDGVEEVALQKGVRRTIEPLGGGARYRAATLLAVPVKSLEGLGDAPAANGALSELRKAVHDGNATGIVVLVEHAFVRDLPEAEARGLADPIYSIERSGDAGVKAVLVSGGASKVSTGISIYSREPKSGLFWGTVAAGSLLTLAFIFLGVWFVRRSKAGIVR